MDHHVHRDNATDHKDATVESDSLKAEEVVTVARFVRMPQRPLKAAVDEPSLVVQPLNLSLVINNKHQALEMSTATAATGCCRKSGHLATQNSPRTAVLLPELSLKNIQLAGHGVGQVTMTSVPSSSNTLILPELNRRRQRGLNHETTEPIRSGGCAPRGRSSREWPLSPSEALRCDSSHLTTYERQEIVNFPEIWFLGQKAEKIPGIEGSAFNHGYDDEYGSYVKVFGDHLIYRYEILEQLGTGAFGQVVKATDHKTRESVAIKIIRNKKKFQHQALIEVKILEQLRRRDADEEYNIIHMISHFRFRNHLCIVFELLGMNLYELIKKNRFQGFSLMTIRHYAISILNCLQLLFEERIIHCDLKLENIVIKPRSHMSIKVIDFGSSCFENQRVYTYIQSRFYRSPEVILGVPYSLPIDIWSFGCLLAELYTGYPLFPGENEAEQLACIMEVIDVPPPQLLEEASRKKLFFDSKGAPRCVTNSKGRRRRPGSRDLTQVTKCSDRLFVDFLARCLTWNPSERITPSEAMQHDWIQSTDGRPLRPKLSHRKRLTVIEPISQPLLQNETTLNPGRPSSSANDSPSNDLVSLTKAKLELTEEISDRKVHAKSFLPSINNR